MGGDTELWGLCRDSDGGRAGGDKCQCYTEEATVWLRLRSFSVAREEGKMDSAKEMKECGVCRDQATSQGGCKAVRNGSSLTEYRMNTGAVILLTAQLAVYSVFTYL